MLVDCREARVLLNQFPHYVPCGILLLARFLEDFRREVDTPVFISANGGYRSPTHQIGGAKSIHAGARRQISIGLATLFFPMQSLSESIARSRHHLVRLFLFGRLDMKKDRPAIIFISI